MLVNRPSQERPHQYFRQARGDLLFHDYLLPHLIAHDPEAETQEQFKYLTNFYKDFKTLPKRHPILNRLTNIPTASPDLLAIIQQEGKV